MPEDIFVPEEVEIEPQPIRRSEYEPVNLADDEELCKEVIKQIQYDYTKYDNDREELDDIHETNDYMFKCSQDATLQEEERKRLERETGDDGEELNYTKSQKCGSTLFHRQVRLLAAFVVDILFSKKDPFTFRARYNPNIFSSPEQADELATMHQLLMRWTMDADNWRTKAIEIVYQLLKYGNIPICVYWKTKTAEILDRWPVLNKAGEQQFDDDGRAITEIERRRVVTECLPTLEVVLNDNFYADQLIGNIQDQISIIVKSMTNIPALRDLQRDGEYVNADKLTKQHIYTGQHSEARDQKDLNAGYDSHPSETNSGQTVLYDCYRLLPIDESKPKGKRWNPEEHELKKYWVTIASGDEPDGGMCLRIERNRDPDDEWPFEMLNSIPDDSDKLYKLSLGQILRGNFAEATTAKLQALDRKTLQNNAPLMIRRGAVNTDDGNLKIKKDKAFYCEDPSSDIREFNFGSVIENMNMLQYLDADSDEAAGASGRLAGDPMGGRTAAAEAVQAYQAANKPAFMMARYMLDKWLRFYARKCVRLWHIYAEDDQILMITDDERYQNVHPAELFGDFNIEVKLVDEFEQNIMQQSQLTYAMQNVLPFFQDVLNKRELVKPILSDILHIDVTKAIKPDNSEETRLRARNMIDMFKSGTYASPTMNDDLDVMLVELEGERIQYKGVEDEHPWLVMLDRAIEETKMLKKQQGPAMGSPAAPPDVNTPGEAVGEDIAGMQGAMGGIQ